MRRSPGRRATRIVVALALVTSGMVVVATTSTNAAAGEPPFELDAAVPEAGTPRALFPNGQVDWVNTAGEGNPPNGLFEPGSDTDCYNNSVVPAGYPGFAATFICDGHSDSRFSGSGQSLATQPELNIVTPSGKTLDDEWPIAAGNNPGKSDFTHAYSAFTTTDDNDCQGDTGQPGDPDLWMITGAHRSDNEGTQFWGVELLQESPGGYDDLVAGNPTTLIFNRMPGDVLLIFDNQGQEGVIAVQVAVWDGVTYTIVPESQCNGGINSASGFANGDATDDGIDDNNEIEAPPWNVPACDPTSDGGKNNCRLAKQGGDPFHLLPERDFFEAMVNLSAYGVGDECFSTLIFTSRSSNEINADLKDVAGANPGLCSANIQIDGDDVNEVNDPHTFTVSVNQQIGAASEGISGVAFELLTDSQTATSDNTIVLDNGTDTDATIDFAASTCDDGTDADGECTIVFTSATPTTVTGTAAATVSIFGNNFDVVTDGAEGSSGPATKVFVDASIAITPDGVNEVGENHKFDVTVTYDGQGITPTIDALDVTYDVAPDSESSDTCNPTDADTSVAGKITCSVTITRATAGTIVADANVQLTFTDTDGNSDTVTRQTDGVGANSDDVTKRFVDASIAIEDDDTNSINDDHTFDVTVTYDDQGTTPTIDALAVTFVGGDGTPGTFDTGTCTPALADTSTAGEISCSVTINSAVAGTFNAHASVTLTFTDGDGNSDTLTRETDGMGNNSDDATKVYVDGSIRWFKVDDLGNPLGGATFEYCQTHFLEDGVQTLLDPAPPCVEVEDNVAPDADGDDGEFLVEGLELGIYEVTETEAPDGYEIDPDTETITVDFDNLTGDITPTFTDPREFKVIVLVCQLSDNTLYSSDVTLADDDGDPDVGPISSSATAPAGFTDAELCGIDEGAVFEPRKVGSYDGNVTIPSTENS